MQPAPPAVLQLAQRLRQLRQQHWPDARLTQDALANGLQRRGRTSRRDRLIMGEPDRAEASAP